MTSDSPAHAPLLASLQSICAAESSIPPFDPTVDYSSLCEALLRENEEGEKTVRNLAKELRCLRKRLRLFQSALRKRPSKTKKRHCRVCGKAYLPAHNNPSQT